MWYLEVKFLLPVALFYSVTSYGYSRYIADSISTNSSDPVEETQHAICKISTEDIEASANATITRQLKGVCSSREMHSQIDQLEKTILAEINLIKQALQMQGYTVNNVQPKALENSLPVYGLDNHDYDNNIESEETESETRLKMNRVLPATKNQTANVINIKKEQSVIPKAGDINSSLSSVQRAIVTYKRDLEATKYNITIQNTELGRSFLYYWKIYDIQDILTYSDTHLESPIFFLLGNALQIKLHPNHLGTHYVALELWSHSHMTVKHRFSILNQNNVQGDLTSQILGINAFLFRISNQKLSNGNFTADGSLIVKLIVALSVQ